MAGWPIWYELMVPDPAKVAPFYKAVLGWEIPERGNPMPNGSEYREIGRSSGGAQGGVLTLTAEMIEQGAQPAWLAYWHVDDVDSTVEQVTRMGGNLLMAAMTMAGIGRMAMVSDPQGAPFYVMTPSPPADNPDATSDAFNPDTPGHAAWNELNTDAAIAQIEFYTTLFDWRVAGEMPMPGDHIYKFLNHAEIGIGAIGSMKPEGMPSSWLPYFRVADINTAMTAIEATGGTIMHGPHEVPNDDHIIVATDPAGAAVGFVGRTVS